MWDANVVYLVPQQTLYAFNELFSNIRLPMMNSWWCWWRSCTWVRLHRRRDTIQTENMSSADDIYVLIVCGRGNTGLYIECLWIDVSLKSYFYWTKVAIISLISSIIRQLKYILIVILTVCVLMANEINLAGIILCYRNRKSLSLQINSCFQKFVLS